MDLSLRSFPRKRESSSSKVFARANSAGSPLSRGRAVALAALTSLVFASPVAAVEKITYLLPAPRRRTRKCEQTNLQRSSR